MLSVVMVPVALNDSVKMQSAACFFFYEEVKNVQRKITTAPR